MDEWHVGDPADWGDHVGVPDIPYMGYINNEDDNENSVLDLKRLISDDIFPCYQRLLEIELGTICLKGAQGSKDPK